jgi:hypothetical protein
MVTRAGARLSPLGWRAVSLPQAFGGESRLTNRYQWLFWARPPRGSDLPCAFLRIASAEAWFFCALVRWEAPSALVARGATLSDRRPLHFALASTAASAPRATASLR